MQNKYNLLKSYEWHGTFWFEDTPDIKFSGKLSYHPSGRIALEAIIFSNSGLGIKGSAECSDGYKHILGLVCHEKKEIEYVSLFKCIHNNLINFDVSVVIFQSLFLFIGAQHFSSNYKFKSLSANIKYIDEFVNFKRCNTLDSIREFKLSKYYNASISPCLHINPDLSLVIIKEDKETTDNYEARKQRIENLQSYIQKEGETETFYIKNTSIDNAYRCMIKRYNKEFSSIDDFNNNFQKMLLTFKFLLCKNLYVEEIYLQYEVHGRKDPYTSSAFLFTLTNFIKNEAIDNIPKSSIANYQWYNPFNIKNCSDENFEKLTSLLTNQDNKLLTDFLISFINKPIDLVEDTRSKEKFILAMALLESEFYSLNQNNNNTKNTKYDVVIEKYACKNILESCFALLENFDIENKNDLKLKDILSNSKTYFLGSILAFLRNKIIHNQQKLKLSVIENEKDEVLKRKKLKFMAEYQDYWTSSYITVPFFTQILSILLLKILYSKITMDTKVLEEAMNRLLQKYHIYGKAIRYVVDHYIVKNML